MKAKKVVAVAAATLMAASAMGVLAGCGSDPEHTINVLLLANENESLFYTEYFKKMEDELAEEGLNYKIKFNGEQEGNYYEALKSKIQNGGTPDIFYVRPNEILQYKDNIVSLQSFADNQDFADLDDIYDIALDMYRFNPETGELGNHEDDLYAFPKDLSTQQLGYNKTLVEKYQQYIKAAGVKLPWEMDWTKETYTWEQYKTMCKAIADHAEANNYASDVPSVEVLAHSFGLNTATEGALIDLSTGKINDMSSQSSPIYQAIKYQAELVDCDAADYSNATYSNFSAGRVCFYGLVGSWEIGEYNENPSLGAGNWEVMPWPTTTGKIADWAGVITSAGYVVSKESAAMEKGDIVKRIAISFMSSATQNELVKERQISLPLIKSWANDYRTDDETYSPASRGVFLDVITGDHGFIPAEYSTYDSIWLDQLSTALELVWTKNNKKADSAVTYFGTVDWADVQKKMQDNYDASK